MISNINYKEEPNIKLSRKYSKVFNTFSDIPLENADISLQDILTPDPDYNFFKIYLREGPAEIQGELANAIQFYAERFGIDLNKFNKSPQYWYSGEHRFYPYIKQGEYSATQLTGNCCGIIDYTFIEGGFVLVVGAPGIKARGTYGKTDGENIIPGSVIFFGYYILVDEANRGNIFHIRSVTPSITSSNTPLRWDLDIYDYREKNWGKSIGSTVIDKKDLVVNRPTITTTTSYVPTMVPVSVPSGLRQTSTAVTRTVANGVVNTGPAFPLTATPIRPTYTSSTVVSPVQSTFVNSNIEVPTVAPVIRDEITNISEEKGLLVTLITRSIVTFGFNCK